MTLLIIVGVIILGIAVFIGMLIHWANTHEVKMVDKTHLDFVVKVGQTVDYNAFINLKDETSAFNQINDDVRMQIADYMQENNLRLKEGHHYFPKRSFCNGGEVIVTLDEYLNCFKFEKIE